MDNITASPLSWPATKARTPAHRRQTPQFGSGNHTRRMSGGFSIDEATRTLKAELERLGVSLFILSTNLRLRQDGLPYSNQKMPEDPGAAVYFKLDGRDTVLACDKWEKVQDNIFVIAKHIDALRGQERWGVGSREQAFAGFAALPPPMTGSPPKHWRDVLEIGDKVTVPNVSMSDVTIEYRRLAKKHQDDEQKLLELNLARDAAREELNG